MRRVIRLARMAGFTLLPVMLAMSLIAGIAFLLNRDNGMNAEMVSGQMDTDRARYAAEAGLQAVNASIQGNNCTGFYPSALTPLTNSNLGGASYSAFAIVPWGNTTSLYSTGSYNGTLVTLTRNNVMAYQATPNTYTLQPNAAAGIDTYIEVNRAFNAGGDTVLWGAPNYDYPMVKFDLSMFPAGSVPLSATLSLFQLSGSGGTGSKSLHRMRSAWVEGTSVTGSGVNWTTSNGSTAWVAGGDYHPTAVASIPYVGTSNYWDAFDVSDMTSAWMSGRYPNNGLIMLMSAGGGNIKYASSDSATAANRPKMTVTYLVPCGMTGPSGAPPTSTTVALNPIADAYIDNQSAIANFGAASSLKFKQVSATDQMRALLKFDASAIPAGTVIQSATLRLDVTSVLSASNNPKAISAYALTQAWTEGSKTGSGTADGVTWTKRIPPTSWANFGGTYRTPSVAMAVEESSGLSPPPGSFRTGWLSWDLKTLTQEWVDGVTVNNGVLLISTVTDEQSVDSKEKGGSTIPQLVITY